MRRSVPTLLVGLELSIVALWFLSVQIETGVDALQYQRMTSAILRDGVAPWTIHPLSYLGIYPGSDSSGVPFLAASFSLVSGTPLSATVLMYDGVLLTAFGLGLFVLTNELTRRADLALLAILMGSLAFGVFTTLSWALDERSFNVALTPVFLFLILPKGVRSTLTRSWPRIAVVGLTSLVMLLCHLSFLLLIPFFVVIPLALGVIRRHYVLHRRGWAPLLFFGAITISPLLLLTLLNAMGVLSSLGLEYQLESSALFRGTSPLIFLLNALVFLGTRIGPANLVCVVLAIGFMASRRLLPSRSILLGALLLTGFLGLPVVLYSKDLLTPIFVVLGAVGLGGFILPARRRNLVVIMVAATLIASSSVAFNEWNLRRTSSAYAVSYWSPPGVTMEMEDGNLWISDHEAGGGCAYGNNAVFLQQITSEPALPFCTGLAIDILINRGGSSLSGSLPFEVQFNGLSSVNPGDWYSSPDIAQMTSNFGRLPGLDFQAGRQMLREYNVTVVVVDLQRPYQVPLYSYGGVQSSRFFTELWANLYPVYMSGQVAVFRLN